MSFQDLLKQEEIIKGMESTLKQMKIDQKITKKLILELEFDLNLAINTLGEMISGIRKVETFSQSVSTCFDMGDDCEGCGS